MNSHILDFNSISHNQIKFDKPQKTEDDYYVAQAYLEDDKGSKNKIIVKTPALTCLSGIVKSENELYCEMDIDRNKDADFYDFIKKTDKHAVDMLVQNKNEWFQTPPPEDIINELHKGVLNKSKIHLTISPKKEVELNNENETQYICEIKFDGLRIMQKQVVSIWMIEKIVGNTDENTDENTDNSVKNKLKENNIELTIDNKTEDMTDVIEHNKLMEDLLENKYDEPLELKEIAMDDFANEDENEDEDEDENEDENEDEDETQDKVEVVPELTDERIEMDVENLKMEDSSDDSDDSDDSSEYEESDSDEDTDENTDKGELLNIVEKQEGVINSLRDKLSDMLKFLT